MVSHGAGGVASVFANSFGPYASAYEVVAVFPQSTKAWDDSAYSGDMYTSKYGVQPLFFRAILDHFS